LCFLYKWSWWIFLCYFDLCLNCLQKSPVVGVLRVDCGFFCLAGGLVGVEVSGFRLAQTTGKWRAQLFSIDHLLVFYQVLSGMHACLPRSLCPQVLWLVVIIYVSRKWRLKSLNCGHGRWSTSVNRLLLCSLFAIYVISCWLSDVEEFVPVEIIWGILKVLCLICTRLNGRSLAYCSLIDLTNI